MARLIWSPRSSRNLQEIGDFIGQSSVRAAQRMVKEIRARAREIPSQPYLGAIVPEYDDDLIRECQVQNFRVIYEKREDDIYVLLVWHGARPLPKDPRR